MDITPPSERFWSKVLLGPANQCWEWVGARHPRGYGNFAGEGCVPIAAHRFAWEEAYGPVPDALHVLHHCDNPPCVNVAHLYLGTNADNIRDKMARNRQSRTGRKLSAADLERIRSNPTRSLRTLAQELNVSVEAVSRVRRGVSYQGEQS
jgi:hypothetical protein